MRRLLSCRFASSGVGDENCVCEVGCVVSLSIYVFHGGCVQHLFLLSSVISQGPNNVADSPSKNFVPL